ncbi:MAG: 50S ribosomal protein L11 methyltransferase, partial [Thermodesulforhabdaceae bacterium]
MRRSSSKPEYYKIQLVFDQPLDESIMEELAASIAMAYCKPVVQVSSEKLELSLTPEEADRLLPSIPEVVRPIAGCAPSIVVESYDSINWESEWKKYIKPTKVGTRFLICPSWEKSSSDSRIVINIDPGMAFGTGHHETTRLCLEWIDKFAMRHSETISDLSFLDVGTGSGILAIGAALVGFSQ